MLTPERQRRLERSIAPYTRVTESAFAKLIKGAEQCTRVLHALRNGNALSYLRLYVLSTGATNHGGQVRLAWTNLAYVTPWALAHTYDEIFVRRVYEVGGLSHAPRILDCGANIGLATLFFTRRYPGARITAFEADPSIAAVLTRNVAHIRGVEVVCAAVGGTEGTVRFHADGGTGGHVDDGGELTVPRVALAHYLDEPVDLLKLDIEGSEFDVIADLSARGLLTQIAHLICEVHVHARTQARVAQLWEELDAAGFRLALSTVRNFARTEMQVPDPAPFAAAQSGVSLLLLHAWRP